MKRVTKLTSLLLSLMLLLSCVSVLSFAAGSIDVSLRVEGIDSCLYTGSYSYKTGSETVLLTTLLKAYDEADDKLTLVWEGDNYVKEINGVKEKTYKGWDGWLFQINGVDAVSGANSTYVKNGDKIVFYYGDPFGVGMQFPELDDSAAADGVLAFTSKDTIYDPVTWEPTVVDNPVADMTVTLTYAKVTLTAVTDAQGKVSFDPSAVASGKYKVSVSRYAENGCPTVLRYAPGEVTVELEGDACGFCGKTHEDNFVGKLLGFFHDIFLKIYLLFVK